MNHNILHTLRRLCAPALISGVMLVAVSCTAELSSEVVPGGGGSVAGESEVTLRLQVPAASGGSKTRAVDATAEQEVNDLYILAFKVSKHDGSETFDYFVTASKNAPTTTNVSEWTASLRVRAEEQTFVMVANAQGTPSKVNEQIAALAAGSVGHEKDDVLAKLTDVLTAAEQTAGFNATAPDSHHPFTMYGQTISTLIEADKGIKLDVKMHRIVARVHIAFTGDAAGTKFTPEKVHLYNYNDRARVIPDGMDVPTDAHETLPTIPAGAVRLPARVDGNQQVPVYTVDAADKKIEHQIYLFETAQPTTGTAEEQHVKRPCLIVEGVYTDSKKRCYYRIDFAATGTKDYMNIVRNHSYNVTVQNVLAPGHDTPEEALTAQAANITATVVKWNDSDIGDIDFDGEHVLGIATMKYQLGKKGSDKATLLQQVKASVELKWKANLYEVDDHGKVDTHTPPAWISFESGAKEASGTGNNRLQDLKFTVERNDATPERRAVMRFTARNLQVDALVVQDQSSPVYINVKIGDRVITEQEFEQAGGWNPDIMTIEYGPEDTELSWQYGAQGLVLTSKRVDGTETADMKGSVNSGVQEEAALTWQGQAGELQDTGQDYETRTGILTLIAKGKEGVVAKSIRLFQKKYGVTLQKTRVLCSSKEERITVKGNMPWQLTMGDGYQEVLDNKMIHPYDGMTTGNSADDYTYSPYYLLFKTMQADLTLGRKEAKFIFTHRERPGISVEKTIGFIGAFNYNGKYYEVLGPVDRSFRDVADQKGYEDENGTPVPDAFMINSSHGYGLTQLGLTDWEINSDARLERGWSFTPHGTLNNVDKRKNLSIQTASSFEVDISFDGGTYGTEIYAVIQAYGLNTENVDCILDIGYNGALNFWNFQSLWPVGQYYRLAQVSVKNSSIIQVSKVGYRVYGNNNWSYTNIYSLVIGGTDWILPKDMNTSHFIHSGRLMNNGTQLLSEIRVEVGKYKLKELTPFYTAKNYKTYYLKEIN